MKNKFRENRTLRVVIVTTLILCGGVSITADPAPSLVALSEDLDFGEVSPQWPPLPGMLTLLVVSDRPWRITLESSARELELLTPAEGWRSVEPGFPVDVAAGAPTGPAGTSIVLSVRPLIDFDSDLGPRKGSLRIALSDGPFLDVPVRFEVPAVAVFRELSQEPIFAINPVTRGLYPVQRRTIHVMSNAPWKLEMTQLSPLTLRGNSMKGAGPILSVTTADRDPIPLAISRPVAIGAGEVTGTAGAVLQFQIALAIEGSELGGEYEAEVRTDVTAVGSGDRR